MADIDKVMKGLKCHQIDTNHRINCADCPYYVDDDNHIRCVNDLHDNALVLLKEQEERLRKLQKDKDKLCLEVSEWKHKFHDAPPEFVSQGVVDQIRWERDTALSQLEQIGKGFGSKMDDIVAMLKEQENASKRNPVIVCPHCGKRVK